jgi:hypothetical protein
LAYIYHYILKDNSKTRQELSNLFHLKSGSGKFWNIWRIDWELPGKFSVYCRRYARFLLENLYYVMRKFRKSSSEVLGYEHLVKEAYDTCLQLCALEMTPTHDFTLHLPYIDSDDLSTKLYTIISHSIWEPPETPPSSQEKSNLTTYDIVGWHALPWWCWIQRIQALQKEKDFARPHLEVFKEWTAFALYSLAKQFQCLPMRNIPEDGKATNIFDLYHETNRLNTLIEAQKRLQKTNSTTTSQPSQSIQTMQSQETILDDFGLDNSLMNLLQRDSSINES